jgi:hypothetical protein
MNLAHARSATRAAKKKTAKKPTRKAAGRAR